jgi:hypothetical protein
MVQNLGNNTIMPVGPGITSNMPNNPRGIKYVVNETFTASPHYFDRPSPNPPPPKTFRKGEIVYVTEGMGFNMQKSTLISDEGGQWNVDPTKISLWKVGQKSGDNSTKIGARDPWTGGVEWSDTFNLRNLFLTVVIIFLIYLFLKHMLPLIKTSLKKS